MVLGQEWPFFQLLFFQEIYARKMSFTIFQNERTPFQATKTRSSKTRKIEIFPKGLTHGFGPKMAIFPFFFFLRCRPVKCLFRYSRTKKRFFRLQKQEGKTLEKLTFFQGVNPQFWFKNGYFCIFYFLENTGQENVFYDILERKNAFVDYKNKKFKISKIRHFFRKGVNPWLWSKNVHFSNFFVRQCRPRKCLLGYSRTKKRLSTL